MNTISMRAGAKLNPTLSAGRLRIMSYNAHACIGLDGKPDPDRIARVIAACHPDVVAMQELDVGRSRSGGVDQVRRIAAALKMRCHFHPTLVNGGQYGIAVFSRIPMRLVKTGVLPGGGRREPRGVIWIRLKARGREVHLFNTHLGLDEDERRDQVRALLGPAWLGSLESGAAGILCGDFNAISNSEVYRLTVRRLRDAARAAPAAGPMKTYRNWKRIDYIFTTGNIKVLKTRIPNSGPARVASDHMPMLADLQIDRTRP